jgi:nucleoside-diphosphate-sugar epimerase
MEAEKERKMNCLLFGASGLIGRHLVPLLREDYTVLTVGRRNTGDCLIDLEQEWTGDGLPDRIDSVIYLTQSEVSQFSRVR